MVGCLLVLLSGSLFAQHSHYIVTFTDKLQTPYSIDRPDEFLSQRAIDKRIAQGIEITDQDLPVDPAYIQGLRSVAAEIEFLYSSKWFNAALAIIPEEVISDVEALNYVAGVELVQPFKASNRSFTAWEPALGKNKKSKRTKELLNAVQNNMVGINSYHEQGFTGEGMLISITDGGFQNSDVLYYFDHLYENNKVLATYNYVKNTENVYTDFDHGTEVFSILGGFSLGEYEGIAYDAEYLLYVTEDGRSDYEYRIEEYNWVFAAEQSDSVGADIINISLGYTDVFEDPAMNYSYEDMDGKTAVISIAAELATQKGMIVVASAGNEGNVPWRYVNAPADAESVIAVGAVNSTGERSAFSSVGPTFDGRLKPEVVALGSSVKVVRSNGNVGSTSGTSFSAPIISGLAALVWQTNPDFTAQEVREYILQSGDNAENPDNLIGYGIPNAELVVSTDDPIVATQDLFTVYPNPTNRNTFFIKYSGDDTISTTVSILNQLGQELHNKKYDLDPNQSLSIDADFLPPSEYLIVLRSKDYQEVKKLLIL